MNQFLVKKKPLGVGAERGWRFEIDLESDGARIGLLLLAQRLRLKTRERSKPLSNTAIVPNSLPYSTLFQPTALTCASKFKSLSSARKNGSGTLITVMVVELLSVFRMYIGLTPLQAKPV